MQYKKYAGHVGGPMVLLLLVTASTLQTGDTGDRGHQTPHLGHTTTSLYNNTATTKPALQTPDNLETRNQTTYRRNLQKKVWKIPHLGVESQPEIQ